jgi:hypothetical protein
MSDPNAPDLPVTRPRIVPGIVVKPVDRDAYRRELNERPIYEVTGTVVRAPVVFPTEPRRVTCVVAYAIASTQMLISLAIILLVVFAAPSAAVSGGAGVAAGIIFLIALMHLFFTFESSLRTKGCSCA